MINAAPRAGHVTVLRRMCTTLARRSAAGSVSETSVKPPEAAGAHVSWPQRAAPEARQSWRRPLNDPAAAHAALTAFLRGVERRGAVFAVWQVGSAVVGGAVLDAALRGVSCMV